MLNGDWVAHRDRCAVSGSGVTPRVINGELGYSL